MNGLKTNLTKHHKKKKKKKIKKKKKKISIFHFLIAAPPTPESPTKEGEAVAEGLAAPVEDRHAVSAPDLAKAAQVQATQDRSGLSECAVGQAAMADVAMGQKASYIPAEGDDASRETPVVAEAVTQALDKATVPSKDQLDQVQTETVEKEKEPPGMKITIRAAT